MSRARVEVEVDAPPEDVWKIVSNPKNLPLWDRHITNVSGDVRNGLRKGTRYSTEIRFMGVRARVDAEVVDIDEPRFSKVKLSGVLEALVTTTITPAGKHRSRLAHEVDYRFRGGPLGGIAAQALRLSGGASFVLRRGTLGQKRQVESLR